MRPGWRRETAVEGQVAAALRGKRTICRDDKIRRDGNELYYLSPERKIIAVEVKAGSGAQPVFKAAAPQALFEARVPSVSPGFNQFTYAVAADGKRFLVNTVVGDTTEMPLTVVVNWLAAVKK